MAESNEKQQDAPRSKSVSFYVTEEFKERLKSAAEAEDKSLSAYLREITSNVLEQGEDTGARAESATGEAEETEEGEEEISTIGRILLAGGPILLDELEEYLDNELFKDHPFSKKLLQLSCPTSSELASFLSRRFEPPELNLKTHDIHQEVVDLVPEEMVTTYNVFPVAQVGPVLCLTQIPPFETEPFRELRRDTGLKICPVECEEDQIRDAIRTYYDLTRDKVDQVIQNREQRLARKEKETNDPIPLSPELRDILVREMNRDREDEWNTIQEAEDPIKPIPAPGFFRDR